jgi:integrase
MSRENRGHGTIYLRGSVWWIQYSLRGKIFRESAHSPDRSKAVSLLKKRHGETSRGKVLGPVAEKVTLKEMTEALLTDYRLRGLRSVATAEHFTKNLLDYFGESARALDITGDRIAAYVEKRQQQTGLANASINRETACLRHAFNLMVKVGRLSRDHIPSAPRLEEAPPRSGFVEPAEFVKLVKALPVYLRDPIRFAYLTGWRKGAVRSLMWAKNLKLEFDSEGKKIVGGAVQLQAEDSKNKRAYRLALTGELLEVIKSAWEKRIGECPYVFHKTTKKGKKGSPIGDFVRLGKKRAMRSGSLGSWSTTSAARALAT